MADDTFHLTAHDVRAQEFSRVFRGYDCAQVEEFRQRVAEALDRLLRDRAQHDERMRGVQEQLLAFRERERAMNEALVAAQQLRTDSKQQAERDADAVLREARAEAHHLIERAGLDERLVRERGEAAVRQFSAYVAAFRGLLERQFAELDVLQAHSRTIVEVQAQAMERSGA